MPSAKDSLRRLAAAAFRLGLRATSRPLALPASALVVAPHPDDETLGCGGLIAAMADAGRRVDVVFLTDGEASHRGHPGFSAVSLAAQRRAEAIAALGALGVGADHASFLGLPDGQLNRLTPDAASRAERRLAELLALLTPDAMLAPYRAGGSTEHTAATALAARAQCASGGGALLEYPIWAWWNPFRLRGRLGRSGNRRFVPDRRAREAKAAALARHKSQVETIPPWTGPALPPILAELCLGREEFFFATSASPTR